MNSNPKTGALDRQAGFPRVAFCDSIGRNLANVIYSEILHQESLI